MSMQTVMGAKEEISFCIDIFFLKILSTIISIISVPPPNHILHASGGLTTPGRLTCPLTVPEKDNWSTSLSVDAGWSFKH